MLAEREEPAPRRRARFFRDLRTGLLRVAGRNVSLPGGGREGERAMSPRTGRETAERWDPSDDAEEALEELIRVMVRREPATTAESVRVRRDEFVCRSCHIVQHQSRLADVRNLVCSGCVGGAVRHRS